MYIHSHLLSPQPNPTLGNGQENPTHYSHIAIIKRDRNPWIPEQAIPSLPFPSLPIHVSVAQALFIRTAHLSQQPEDLPRQTHHVSPNHHGAEQERELRIVEPVPAQPASPLRLVRVQVAQREPDAEEAPRDAQGGGGELRLEMKEISVLVIFGEKEREGERERERDQGVVVNLQDIGAP